MSMTTLLKHLLRGAGRARPPVSGPAPAVLLVVSAALSAVLAAAPAAGAPLSCQQQCVWAPLTSCTTSCTNPESGYVTTCGAYNYVCYDIPVCGNDDCEDTLPLGTPSWVVPENHGNCARDCTDGANAIRNACVPWVPNRFNQISSNDKTFKINNHGGSATAQPQWDDLEHGNWTNCHFQGAARLRTSPWIAVVGNNVADDQIPGLECRGVAGAGPDDGAVLFFARMGSKESAGNGKWGSGWSPSQDQVESFLAPGDLPGQWHPGGMQAIGDYLVVGVDSNTHVYTIAVADPYNPWIEDDFHLNAGGAPGQANAVGVVREASGRYLLGAFTGAGEVLRLYRSQTFDVTSPAYQSLAEVTWQQPGQVESFESIALVRECGTHAIYLVGFYNTAILGQIGGSNKAQLWRIDLAGGTASATHVKTRDLGDADSTFDAGVGLYVEPDTGKLAIYSTEHWNDGTAFHWPWEEPNRDLDVSEWW